MASSVFEVIDLLDDLENITLKDKEKHILDALMESDYNMLSRSDLSKLTKIPDSTLRRTLHKLEGLCLVKCSRSSIKFIRLNPVLIELFRFIRFTGRCDHDFVVMRRNISHFLLQSSGYSKQNLCDTSHSTAHLKTDYGEELGQRMKY